MIPRDEAADEANAALSIGICAALLLIGFSLGYWAGVHGFLNH